MGWSSGGRGFNAIAVTVFNAITITVFKEDFPVSKTGWNFLHFLPIHFTSTHSATFRSLFPNNSIAFRFTSRIANPSIPRDLTQTWGRKDHCVP